MLPRLVSLLLNSRFTVDVYQQYFINFPGLSAALCYSLTAHVIGFISSMGSTYAVMEQFRKLLLVLIPGPISILEIWLYSSLFPISSHCFSPSFNYLFLFVSHIMVCQFSNFVKFHFLKFTIFLVLFYCHGLWVNSSFAQPNIRSNLRALIDCNEDFL